MPREGRLGLPFTELPRCRSDGSWERRSLKDGKACGRCIGGKEVVAFTFEAVPESLRETIRRRRLGNRRNEKNSWQ